MSASPIAAAPMTPTSSEVNGRGAGPRTLREALAEFVRHGSPQVLLGCCVASVAARIAVGQWSAWDLVAIAGLLLYWPLQEWMIHVFILHAKPLKILGRTLDFRVPRKHRAHHREPWCLDLLFIPMHSFLYSIPTLVGVWFLVTPSLPLALSGIAAHFALALHYEWIHFLVHTRVQPRTALYRRLWKNHRRHHFKNEHYWFGVTMLGGDRLLGTAPEVGDVTTSPTARTLAS